MEVDFAPLLTVVDMVAQIILTLAAVVAIDAAEARRLAALVLHMALEGVGPHVRLAALVADVLRVLGVPRPDLAGLDAAIAGGDVGLV